MNIWSSLGICGALVPGPVANTKMCSCSSPIGGPSESIMQRVLLRYLLLKKAMCNWTCTVQTPVTQGSTIFDTGLTKLVHSTFFQNVKENISEDLETLNPCALLAGM